MKTYVMKKKLELNKKTIAHLDDTSMNEVKGGLWSEPSSCWMVKFCDETRAKTDCVVNP